MGYLLAITRLLIYIGVFSIFFLIGLMVHILFFVSKLQRNKWILFFTCWWAKTTCWVLNFQVNVVGDELPKPGSLIVANHVGSPDIFILGACFKPFLFQRQKFPIGPFLIYWHGLG